MKELFPEQYGLAGHELAAAAMVKFYINEVGAKAELKNIIGSDVEALMQKVSDRMIVQNISMEMLEFLMRLCEE